MKTLFIVQINKVGGGYRYEITTDVDLVEKHLKNGEEIDDDVPVNKLADISGEVTFFIPFYSF